jgi:hypothetical protein
MICNVSIVPLGVPLHNGFSWNGMEWNGMEWNGMEGKEWEMEEQASRA